MTRDEVIALAREAGFTEGDIFIFPDLIVHFAALVAAHEREECAKVCEDRERTNLYGVKECATAIRARKEK